jgi:predicted DCC family thiol-disulfide oxidoreductase YuxK
MRAMHVVRSDGRIVAGADALLYLARHAWWGWPLWLLGQVPGARWLIARLYGRIARNRYRHTCKSGVCSLPEGP